MRYGTAPEDLSQFVCPAGPRLPDDADGVRGYPPRMGPLEQEGRYGLVEQLVRRSRGPNHVVIDLPVRHPLENRLAGPTVAPAAPLDQQATLRMRVQSPYLGQQLAPGRPAEPLRGEDERDVLPRVRKQLELDHRLLRRGHADDPVAPRVAIDEFALDLAQCARVFVDGYEDWYGQGIERYRGAPERSVRGRNGPAEVDPGGPAGNRLRRSRRQKPDERGPAPRSRSSVCSPSWSPSASARNPPPPHPREVTVATAWSPRTVASRPGRSPVTSSGSFTGPRPISDSRPQSLASMLGAERCFAPRSAGRRRTSPRTRGCISGSARWR